MTLYDRMLRAPIEKRLLSLFIIALAVIASAFLYYASHFGWDIDPKGTKGDWGMFGDFIGGVTNPVLAFLTFIGLLWNLAITSKQLEDAKQESKRQEDNEIKKDIFQMVDTIAKDINELLQHQVPCMLANVGYADMVMPFYNFVKSKYDLEDAIWVLDRNEVYVDNVVAHVLMLKRYLEEYSYISGTDFVVDYYKNIYLGLVRYLTKVDKIDDEVTNYFEVRTTIAIEID